ncbi:hypothetical protein VNO77_34291 [Canavalia gladiata]|uniref:Uncharacterized protein n=1 Tax=Canavalia gladiata TaxID=3824 RepID=A0AAN9PZ48_CANGL
MVLEAAKEQQAMIKGSADNIKDHSIEIAYRIRPTSCLALLGMGKLSSKQETTQCGIRGFDKYMEVEGQEEEEQRPNVTAWHNIPHPEERLRFWSDPDTELRLADWCYCFRRGIDWLRIALVELVNGLKESVNYAAL